MKALIYDTETNAKNPSEADLVQLAAILEDTDSGKTMAQVNLLIRTNGWDIPAEAQRVHGISKVTADAYGIRVANATFLFRDLVETADIVVAHNLAYDLTVMRRVMRLAEAPAIEWGKVRQCCTMLLSTPILKLPAAAGRRGFKWPTLQECMTHFHGETIVNAHDAMADAQACRMIFKALLQAGVAVT